MQGGARGACSGLGTEGSYVKVAGKLPALGDPGTVLVLTGIGFESSERIDSAALPLLGQP